MKKEPKRNARRILLVDLMTPPHKAFGEYSDVFLASVAVLDDSDNTPRNWSRPYSEDRIKDDMGGFTVRAFISSIDRKVLSSVTARRVQSMNISEYEETAKAIRAFEKNCGKLYDQLGGCSDGVEGIIRNILALGVREVFIRPEGERATNLSQGRWMRMSTGDLSSLLRRTFAAPEQPAALAV